MWWTRRGVPSRRMQRRRASQSGVTSTVKGLLGMEQDLRNE